MNQISEFFVDNKTKLLYHESIDLRLRVHIMSRTCFRVNLRSVVA